MPSRLIERVVLDVGGVDQHLVAAAVVAVLPRLEPPAILVHVQKMPEESNALQLQVPRVTVGVRSKRAS